MMFTFFFFFYWLHDSFLCQSELSHPPSLLTPVGRNLGLTYEAANPVDDDEGHQLVRSIMRQYTQKADEKTLKRELAGFQNAEQHLLRMLRGPFYFERFGDASLLFPLSPASTPLHAVRNAICFVSTDFVLLKLTCSCGDPSTCRGPSEGP